MAVHVDDADLKRLRTEYRALLQTFGTETGTATRQASQTIREFTTQTVAGEASKRRALQETLNQYRLLASEAVRGSAEQAAANKLAGNTARQLGLEVAGAGRSVNILGHEFRVAETNMNRGFRGMLAGTGAVKGLRNALVFGSTTFVGFYGLAAAARSAYNRLSEMSAEQAQTRAAVKSTGEVAGVSAQHIDALANAELRKTGIDNEQVKSAENVLLRFTSIRDVANNPIFDEATKSTLDLSKAMHIDLQSAALQVGKALNNPVIGMTALRREGVSFTTGQTNTIKKLAETNDMLDAQKLILQHLQVQFGGTADQWGHTLPGAVSHLQASLKNLEASGLKSLEPELVKLANDATAWMDRMEKSGKLQADVNRIMGDTKTVVGDVAAVVKDAAAAFQLLAGGVGGSKNAVELLAGVFVGYKMTTGLLDVITRVKELRLSLLAIGNPEVLAALAGAAAGIALAQLVPAGPGAGTNIDVPGARIAAQRKAHPNNNIVTNISWDAKGVYATEQSPATGAARTVGISAKAAAKVLGISVSDLKTQMSGNAAHGGGALLTSSTVLAAASSFSNTPYQWGGGHAAKPGPSFSSGHGRTGLGLDCSGYARAVLASLGIYVNGNADSLLGQAKSHPAANKLQPGDLVFYEGIHPNHVMVYIGNGQVIGETHTGAAGPETWPVGYLKITGTGRYVATGKSGTSGGGASGGSAAPPPGVGGGKTSKGSSTVTLPQAIQQQISIAKLAVETAKSTLSPKDDAAANQQLEKAVETEIAWLRKQLTHAIAAGKVGKQISLTDALTSSVSELAGLRGQTKLMSEQDLAKVRGEVQFVASHLAKTLPADMRAALGKQVSGAQSLIALALGDGVVTEAEGKKILAAADSVMARYQALVKKHLAEIKAALQTAQTGADNALSQLATDTTTAFDAHRAAGLAALAVNVNTQYGSFDYTSGGLTPGEIALQALTGAHDAAAQQKTYDDAATAKKKADDRVTLLAKAGFSLQSDVMKQAITDQQTAQDAFDTATYDSKVASLNAQVTVEKTAADTKLTQAQKDYNAETDLQRRHLQEMLTNLQDSVDAGTETVAQARQDVAKIWAQFGIDAATAGTDVGSSFSTQLDESLQAAYGSLAKLRQAQIDAGVAAPPGSASNPGDPGVGTPPNDRGGPLGVGPSAPSFVWDGSVWTKADLAAFKRLLSSEGVAYATWAKNHASAAAVFAADGAVITKPTLVYAGEVGRARPEIFTPQKLMADTFTKVLDERGGDSAGNAPLIGVAHFHNDVDGPKTVAEISRELRKRGKR